MVEIILGSVIMLVGISIGFGMGVAGSKTNNPKALDPPKAPEPPSPPPPPRK